MTTKITGDLIFWENRDDLIFWENRDDLIFWGHGDFLGVGSTF